MFKDFIYYIAILYIMWQKDKVNRFFRLYIQCGKRQWQIVLEKLYIYKLANK